MTSGSRHNLLGIGVDAVDYDVVVARILEAAESDRPMAVTALAVHGVVSGVLDTELRSTLNGLDLAVPDGQPVRWGLNLLYGTGLTDQVRGTTLTLRVLESAAARGLAVYFYGSRIDVLELIAARLQKDLPDLQVAGYEPSRFAKVGRAEQREIAERIRDSGARILFVGLGCPRQERFVYALRDMIAMPALAVGAAFDYLAGTLAEPPDRLRRAGLEWLWRLALEPRRLWRRYAFLNPLYVLLLVAQLTTVWRPRMTRSVPHSSRALLDA